MSTRATRLILLLIVFGLPVSIVVVEPRGGREAAPGEDRVVRRLPALFATEATLVVGFLFARSQRAATASSSGSRPGRARLSPAPASRGRRGFDLLCAPAAVPPDIGRSEPARAARLREIG